MDGWVRALCVALEVVEAVVAVGWGKIVDRAENTV